MEALWYYYLNPRVHLSITKKNNPNISSFIMRCGTQSTQHHLGCILDKKGEPEFNQPFISNHAFHFAVNRGAQEHVKGYPKGSKQKNPGGFVLRKADTFSNKSIA